MDLAKWIANFRVLHQKARTNSLTGPEQGEYLEGRNELARAVLASQKTTLAPGETPRQALRATRVLPVEIDVGGRPRPFLTLDVYSGGFSAIVGDPVQGKVRFSLKLPSENERIEGEAVCVQSEKQPGRTRCSFRFENLGAVAREKVEMFVFDALLENLKS
jgi:hypothetical protein